MTMVETYSPWAYAALGVVALSLGLVLAVDYHGPGTSGRYLTFGHEIHLLHVRLMFRIRTVGF